MTATAKARAEWRYTEHGSAARVDGRVALRVDEYLGCGSRWGWTAYHDDGTTRVVTSRLPYDSEAGARSAADEYARDPGAHDDHVVERSTIGREA